MKNSNIVIVEITLDDQKSLIYIVTHHLYNFNKNFCAKTIKYRRNIFIKFILLMFLSHNISVLIVFTNLIYFIQNLLKIILLIIHTPYIFYRASYLHNILPIYSILIPLYNEVGNIKIITEGIDSIIYPLYCLDIVVLLEESDKETIKELLNITISTPIRIVIIPDFPPKTKPKALNYGYFFTKGEFLTIYDAEDKPDPDQLLKALKMFNSLSKEYICLQAKLNFYNKNENILTKFFSMEYFHWFNCLLSGLEKLSLPISLGGTSNHFKSRILKEIGLWDSYNVTEDADLSIRLYIQGYKVKLMDSYTLEESPLDLFSWLFQRTRWIKGILQTIMVYIRVSLFVVNKMRVRDHFTFVGFLICGTYSFYILPILIILSITYPDAIYMKLWIYNIMICLIYMYVSAIHIIANNTKIIFTLNNIVALIFFPLYFTLHTIAAYLALFQLITKPFKWNKTKHGITRF